MKLLQPGLSIDDLQMLETIFSTLQPVKPNDPYNWDHHWVSPDWLNELKEASLIQDQWLPS